jgi:hypothetical protein
MISTPTHGVLAPKSANIFHLLYDRKVHFLHRMMIFWGIGIYKTSLTICKQNMKKVHFLIRIGPWTLQNGMDFDGSKKCAN